VDRSERGGGGGLVTLADAPVRHLEQELMALLTGEIRVRARIPSVPAALATALYLQRTELTRCPRRRDASSREFARTCPMCLRPAALANLCAYST